MMRGRTDDHDIGMTLDFERANSAPPTDPLLYMDKSFLEGGFSAADPTWKNQAPILDPTPSSRQAWPNSTGSTTTTTNTTTINTNHSNHSNNSFGLLEKDRYTSFGNNSNDSLTGDYGNNKDHSAVWNQSNPASALVSPQLNESFSTGTSNTQMIPRSHSPFTLQQQQQQQQQVGRSAGQLKQNASYRYYSSDTSFGNDDFAPVTSLNPDFYGTNSVLTTSPRIQQQQQQHRFNMSPPPRANSTPPSNIQRDHIPDNYEYERLVYGTNALSLNPKVGLFPCLIKRSMNEY
ncbi:uncharacterized protein BX664DRAFT_199104 [Halteromyces radiatus]|uniref:uncharacterized protein n=1 Tax=Halteromyces radiatus TaxID=101107 RepID=UPI00221F7937|nr:uncharacterized protein BX664DRAFT_199104 [Halteromyces radiatus]KAI8081704.1 hypothetical protein BX664DRAFT_199104 [Halteromyces radiatus]